MRRQCFNGGPGNCPAKPVGSATRPTEPLVSLQWRAGQLPGQTVSRRPECRCRPKCFNGGPGNCPAKPEVADEDAGLDDLASMEGRAIARPNNAISIVTTATP